MRTRRRMVGILIAGLALVSLAACSGADDDAGGAREASGAAPQGRMEFLDSDDGPAEDAAEAALDDDVAGTGASGALPVDVRQSDGRHVIRQGWFTVVYESTFDEAFTAVAAIAERLGGGISGVTSETVDGGEVVGEVTVRVPVDAYDQLLRDVAAAGEVISRHVTEEDVSGQVVDLRSRLRHLERQETFYLGLFDQADGVSDAITIQNNLERVQQAKEEVQGRLDHLEDRTSTSTLSVQLVPDERALDWQGRRAGFAGYWEDAVDAFVRVAGTLLVVAVGGMPLFAAAGIALAAAFVLVRASRSKRGAQLSPDSASMTAE